jgi:hypothetical protein
MPPKKSACVSSTADRAKDRARKRLETEEKDAKDALAKAIEKERLRAEEEVKKFKNSVRDYPYEVRVEAAAVVARSANNKFTQAQLADRYLIGETSLKKKIKTMKKNDDKARQNAIISGVAAVEVLPLESGLSVEADNEAHLEYIGTRAQVARAVHDKKKIVDELKSKHTSLRVEKRQVLFVFDFYFHVPDFDFICREKKQIWRLKLRRES